MEPYSFDLQRIFIGDLPSLFWLEIAFRTAFLFLYLLALLRLLGQRSMGELTPLELLILISLGSAVGDPMFYPTVPLLHGMIVITVVVGMQYGITLISNNSPKLEAVIDGRPQRVVADGALDLKGMRRARLSKEEVFQELRQQGYRHLGQVRRAYLETDGKVSVYGFEKKDVRPGFSLIPFDDFETIDRFDAGDKVPSSDFYACDTCCHITALSEDEHFGTCHYCEGTAWSDVLHAVLKD